MNLEHRIRRIEKALVLLSEVTPGKVAGSYADWEEFVKLIREIRKDIEHVKDESRYMLRQG